MLYTKDPTTIKPRESSRFSSTTWHWLISKKHWEQGSNPSWCYSKNRRIARTTTFAVSWLARLVDGEESLEGKDAQTREVGSSCIELSAANQIPHPNFPKARQLKKTLWLLRWEMYYSVNPWHHRIAVDWSSCLARRRLPWCPKHNINERKLNPTAYYME